MAKDSAAPAPIDLAALGATLVDVLKASAQQFLANNSDAVIALGADTVKAVLTQAVLQQLPTLAELPENATAAQVAAQEELLLVRDRSFQLVSKAEAQDAARVAALKTSAIAVAKSVVGSIGGVLAGIARQALLGA